MSGYKYIYNLKQALFYIQKGVVPVDMDINQKTKKTFVKFKFDDTQQAYEEWCENKM